MHAYLTEVYSTTYGVGPSAPILEEADEGDTIEEPAGEVPSDEEDGFAYGVRMLAFSPTKPAAYLSLPVLQLLYRLWHSRKVHRERV